MDLSFALGGRGPRNAKSRYSLPPAHPLGALELNTYPQTCEENVSRRPHITHHFVTTVANWCRTEERAVQAELVQERSERGTEGALGPVLDLEHKREAVQRGGAEEPFRSALGDPARNACIRFVSSARGPRISAGYARIASATRPSTRLKAIEIRVSDSAKVTTPQPSVAVAISSVPARRPTSASAACWQGCPGRR